MTRFSACDPDARRSLVADAIAAHRARASLYVTFETDPDETDDEVGHGAPWVQFGDGVVSLDCTDDELDRLKRLLDSFPAFTVDDLISPEEAEGTHARIATRTDDERISQFVDRVFQETFDRPSDYRLWVTEL
jgi:hypothetical protein